MNKNYIKFLTFSIVILGGGKTLNSNICYGMEGNYKNLDPYFLQLDKNDVDNNGNIIENDKFLTDHTRLTSEYYNNENALLRGRAIDRVISPNIYELFDAFLRNSSLINSTFKKIFSRYSDPNNLKNITMSCNELNNITNNFITLQNVNQYGRITLQQFFNYCANKILLSLTETVGDILYIYDRDFDRNARQHKKELETLILKEIAYCINNVQNGINAFNKVLKQVNNQDLNNYVSKKTKVFTRQLDKLNNNLLIKLYKTIPYNKEGSVSEKDLLDKNLYPACSDVIVDLYKLLYKKNPNSESTKLIYKFGQYYSSITANLSKDEINSIIDDIGFIGKNSKNNNIINLDPDKINKIEYSTKDINKNTNGIFRLQNNNNIKLKQLLQYFSNKITLKVIDMITNMVEVVDLDKQNDEQVLNDVIKTYVFKCIEEIKHIAHHAVVFIKNDEQFNKAFGNTNVAETITNSIAGGIDQLDSLIE